MKCQPRSGRATGCSIGKGAKASRTGEDRGRGRGEADAARQLVEEGLVAVVEGEDVAAPRELECCELRGKGEGDVPSVSAEICRTRGVELGGEFSLPHKMESFLVARRAEKALDRNVVLEQRETPARLSRRLLQRRQPGLAAGTSTATVGALDN